MLQLRWIWTMPKQVKARHAVENAANLMKPKAAKILQSNAVNARDPTKHGTTSCPTGTMKWKQLRELKHQLSFKFIECKFTSQEVEIEEKN